MRNCSAVLWRYERIYPQLTPSARIIVVDYISTGLITICDKQLFSLFDCVALLCRSLSLEFQVNPGDEDIFNQHSTKHYQKPRRNGESLLLCNRPVRSSSFTCAQSSHSGSRFVSHNLPNATDFAFDMRRDSSDDDTIWIRSPVMCLVVRSTARSKHFYHFPSYENSTKDGETWYS